MNFQDLGKRKSFICALCQAQFTITKNLNYNTCNSKQLTVNFLPYFFQLGGGIWGGCLAAATGAAGVLAGAKDLCPLKGTAHRMACTTFLALSLISFAVSQLVLVLAATGLARDLSKAQEETDDPHYVSLYTCFTHEPAYFRL